MRVLFTVFPAAAHLLPMVSTAWALQSAGHEVCVAFPPGAPTGVAAPDFHKSVAAMGLTPVPCGDEEPLAVHDRGHPGFDEMLPTMEESERYVAELSLDAADRPSWDVFYHFVLLAIRDFHPPGPRRDMDALVDFARRWRPDLVFWDPWLPGGAVAARACGAAQARFLNSPDYAGWAIEAFGRRGLENPLAEAVRPLAERHGVEVDDELLAGQWTVDPYPAGMRLPGAPDARPVRYVPFTGAEVLPEWLYERPERPRVGLSLGVSARAFIKGDWGRTAKLLEAVAEVDAEVVATLNDNQLGDLSGPVPANVRTIDYVPLNQLLPTCSALIHHGSTGTFSVASAMNVPQLICDTDEPTRCVATVHGDRIDWDFPCQKQLTATLTASYATDRGAGLRLNHQTQSAAEIRELILRVLREPTFQDGAQAIHEDWLATPSPIDIVPDVVKLAAQHRVRAA